MCWELDSSTERENVWAHRESNLHLFNSWKQSVLNNQICPSLLWIDVSSKWSSADITTGAKYNLPKSSTDQWWALDLRTVAVERHDGWKLEPGTAEDVSSLAEHLKTNTFSDRTQNRAAKLRKWLLIPEPWGVHGQHLFPLKMRHTCTVTYIQKHDVTDTHV